MRRGRQHKGGRAIGVAMLLTLWIAAPTPARAKEHVNLIPNASVETEDPDNPGMPLDWRADAFLDAVATFEWSPEAANGSRALRVEMTSVGDGDAKWWSAPIPIPEGTRHYLVRDTFRSSALSALMIRAVGADESQYQWIPVISRPPRPEWNVAENIVELPEWTREVNVAHILREEGWLETDSYAMEAVSPDDVPIEGPTPLVSIAFDDGWNSGYIHAIPVLEEYGVRATHFIHADWVDKPGYADHLTSKKLRYLAELGHEIGSHALYHVDLSTLPMDEVEIQVVESRRILEDLGFPIHGFVPPGGWFNGDILTLIENNYDYMRGVEAGLNYKPYDIYGLRAVVVDDTMDQADLRAWVEKAAGDEAWLILLYHRFNENPQTDSTVTPESFRQTIEYLVARKADIRPLGEVLGVWSPDEYTPSQSGPVEEKSFDQPNFDESTGCALSAGTPPASSALAISLLLLALLVLGRAGRRDH